MSIAIRVSAEYDCAGPNCCATSKVSMLVEELVDALQRDALPELEPENLPVGWIHVLANPAGVQGTKNWNFCSAMCLADSLDRTHSGGVGQVTGR